MRKSAFRIYEKKTQISCAVATKLNSIYYNSSTSLFQNFKHMVMFCGRTARFVLGPGGKS